MTVYRMAIPTILIIGLSIATCVAKAGPCDFGDDKPSWDEGTKIISSTCKVGEGVTLTIKAGVKVLFASEASLVVEAGGTLIANGKKENPVEFIPQVENKPWGELDPKDKSKGIGGIQFLPGSTGKMDWCIVRQAFGINIKIHGSSPTIKYCDIQGAKIGIEVSGKDNKAAAPTISHSWIHDNFLWGLHFLDDANGTVEQNFIYCNKKKPGAAGDTANGIHIWKNSKPTITNNLIFGSEWGIEVGWASHATIENNLFAEVNYGILYYDYENGSQTPSKPKVKDNYFSVNDHMLAAPIYDQTTGQPSTGKFTTGLQSAQSSAIGKNTEVKGQGPTFPNVACPAAAKPDFTLKQYPPANGYGPNSIQMLQRPAASRTITITVQVDGTGKVSKTIEPIEAKIRGASKNGTADGGSVNWVVKSNGQAKAKDVTVTITFVDKKSPFRNYHFKIGNIDIDSQGLNGLYSGRARVESGSFEYEVEVKQGGETVGGEGIIVVGPIDAPGTTEWGLIVLGLLLAGSLAWMIRRRFGTRPTGA